MERYWPLTLILLLASCSQNTWHDKYMSGYTDPIPQEDGVIEEAVDWTIENVDKFDGISLTGKSIGKLDRNFNPYRIKLGVINTDLGSDIKTRNEEEIYRHVHEGHRHRRTRGSVFGISFRKEF